MPAHPLAELLAQRLARGDRVLDFGSGKGRNGDALRESGLAVTSLGDADASTAVALRSLRERFDGIVATHALLHGSLQSVAERIDAIAHALVDGGLFFATFASTRDARYGSGERVAEETFAPKDGDEAGVPHVYYDEERLRAILTPYFRIESVDEQSADAIAGGWAHPTTPLHGAVHWLVRAVKSADQ
jgi:hypothetical protein